MRYYRKHEKIKIIIVVHINLFIFTCTNLAGGTSTIKGKVVVDNINILGTIVDSYDAQDLDVFIIYGKENNTFDDDQKTSHDGSFEFKYLNPGDYEIFVYSECMFCPQGQDSLILRSVKISNSNEVNELETIHVANFI